MNGVYVILYACSVMCAQPRPTITLLHNEVLTQATTPTQAFLQEVAQETDARTCEPDVLITADRAIAEKALESTIATVFRVDRKLKVYKLKREAVYHVDEVEQAAPAAPKP